jgi:multiple sugar transport system permease protein
MLFVLPLVWMAVASLHPPGVPLPRTLRLLPDEVTLANFGLVWTLVPFPRYLLNSLLVVALAIPLTVVSSSWAGYSIARLPGAAQRRWIIFSLALLMVPAVALWVPRFLLYRQLGWLDTPLALLAPAWMGTSPFYVLMYYRAFRRIPVAIYDSARLDGAGVLRTWGRVVFPMAWPTTAGVAVLSFVVYWGDYISPLLYIGEDSRFTLPVGLRLLEALHPAEWGVLMAGALLATAIPLLLFGGVVAMLDKRPETRDQRPDYGNG